MNYYAAFNQYGTESSVGFANTWRVVAFDSKNARDSWVEQRGRKDISARAIKRAEIGRYLDGPPKPFSGDAYCWEMSHKQPLDDDVPGYAGSIVIGHPSEHEGRFN